MSNLTFVCSYTIMLMCTSNVLVFHCLRFKPCFRSNLIRETTLFVYILLIIIVIIALQSRWCFTSVLLKTAVVLDTKFVKSLIETLN